MQSVNIRTEPNVERPAMSLLMHGKSRAEDRSWVTARSPHDRPKRAVLISAAHALMQQNCIICCSGRRDGIFSVRRTRRRSSLPPGRTQTEEFLASRSNVRFPGDEDGDAETPSEPNISKWKKRPPEPAGAFVSWTDRRGSCQGTSAGTHIRAPLGGFGEMTPSSTHRDKFLPCGFEKVSEIEGSQRVPVAFSP
jgi:hypothetical protein